MPYILSAFGSLTLPQYEGSNDVGAGSIQSPVVELPGGGVFDALGGDQAIRGRYQLRKRGELVATSAANFKTQANALRAALGKRDVLWRIWDDATTEWVYARLVDVSAERTRGNLLHQEYTLTFEVISSVWSSQTATTDTTSIDTSPKTVVMANAGNADVENAVITIDGSATPITSLTIGISGVCEFTWTGSLGSGEELVIDCGARSVKLDGVDDYDNFELTANHVIDAWLRLAPGNNSVVFTVSPAGALPVAQETVYYNGWH